MLLRKYVNNILTFYMFNNCNAFSKTWFVKIFIFASNLKQSNLFILCNQTFPIYA